VFRRGCHPFWPNFPVFADSNPRTTDREILAAHHAASGRAKLQQLALGLYGRGKGSAWKLAVRILARLHGRYDLALGDLDAGTEQQLILTLPIGGKYHCAEIMGGLTAARRPPHRPPWIR
jgi:hypothetical protein